MQYLNAIFTVGQPSSTEGIACEACVYARGEHAEDCRQRERLIEQMVAQAAFYEQ